MSSLAPASSSPTLGWSAEDLRRHATHIRRAVRDQAVPFEGQGSLEPGWNLDAMPVVVDGAEWSRLGRALEQRAMVFELLLEDIFGPQRLLASGNLPTLALLAHRDYLRECVGLSIPGSRRLMMYSADVVRGPDSQFVVLSDHTEMASGVGFAVQNREVMARIGPDQLHQAAVRPIADWLSSCRGALAALAPEHIEQPRIVIMTPGPTVSDHLEHTFLARTIGFTLAEPRDLTVRDGKVWLKSVGGMEPVHVLLRLVRSDDCDPLELRAASTFGVAGLVEACRRGNVALANPLGAGVAECPALLASFDRLTRMLLGEEPLIASPPTWWCGDATSMSHVLANLDDLVIRASDRAGGHRVLTPAGMTQAERSDLRTEILASPHVFVGQQIAPFGTEPSYLQSPSADAPDVEGALRDRPVVTRAFLVRTACGYRSMDGGLSRTADSDAEIAFTDRGISKDTWVSGGSGSATPPIEAGRSLAPIDLRSSITSRAAESMFWVGRSLERAQTAIRLVRAVHLVLESWPEMSADPTGSGELALSELVIAVVGSDTAVGDGAPTDAPPPSLSDLLASAVTDPARFRGLDSTLQSLLSNATAVRELFSGDSWRLLSELGDLHVRLRLATPESATELAEEAITPLLAVSGLMNDGMVRDPGWRFLDIGRRIEAALLMMSGLRATMGHAHAPELVAPLSETALNVWDSLIAYRRRYRSDIEATVMFDMLFCDETNPRSLLSQLTVLLRDVAGLPGPEDVRTAVTVDVEGLVRLARSIDCVRLAKVDRHGKRRALIAAATDVEAALLGIARDINLHYFVQIRPSVFEAHLTPEVS